jgi:hypothetical protein
VGDAGVLRGSASAPLIAAAICAGVASAFHLMLITWITVFGFVLAAHASVVIIMAPAQTAEHFSSHRFLLTEC